MKEIDDEDLQTESGNMGESKLIPQGYSNLVQNVNVVLQASLDTTVGETVSETDPKTNMQRVRNESVATNVGTCDDRNKDITKVLVDENKAGDKEVEKTKEHEGCSIFSQNNCSEVELQANNNDDKSICDKDIASKLIHRCLEALVYGLQRFPQHYKSQFRLAHSYLHIPSYKVHCMSLSH